MEPNNEEIRPASPTAEEAAPSVENVEAAIEAVLFAAGYPVAYQKLSDVLGLPPKQVKTFVSHMAEKYRRSASSRGIQLLTFPDTCQLCTKEEYLPYIREALGIRRGGNLSASSMEVLSVVAYNQPVTRVYVDTVRGVDSSYAMNSLIDKALIESVGRLDAPGRPMLYGTTDKFLRVFGLSSLEDLPKTATLVPPADVVMIAEDNSDQLTIDGQAEAEEPENGK